MQQRPLRPLQSLLLLPRSPLRLLLQLQGPRRHPRLLRPSLRPLLLLPSPQLKLLLLRQQHPPLPRTVPA